MNLKATLAAMNIEIDLSTKSEIVHACEAIIAAQSFNACERDTLRAAYKNGPLWDGDLPSKAGRDELVSKGFMERIVVKGEDGYNACTLRGAMVYKAIRTLLAPHSPPVPTNRVQVPPAVPPAPFVKK